MNELKKQINEVASTINGTVAVGYINLDNDEELFINEKVSMHAASTMKTPVMIEVYRQAAKGKFKLHDSITVKNEFKSIVDGSTYSMDLSEDSGEGLYEYIGKKRTIFQLVYDMITVSSNLATNILIDLVGAENVMNTMKEIGANDIKVLRGVEDIKAYRKGMNNTATAYDLALIFQAIENGTVASKEACNAMISILLEQEFNDKIPGKLPEDVKVAHKTGWITGISHDSGIVYLPDGKRYVLVILSRYDDEKAKVNDVIAQISYLIYKHVSRK